MPFALVTIGLVMVVTGINNTYSQFASQLSNDLFGQKGFIPWLLAIGAVGALGYAKSLRQFSHYFLALILIGLVLSNKGVFQHFQAALASGPTTPQAPPSSPGVTANSSPAAITSAITSNQTGPFGSQPQSAGQAKAFGWLNYLFGLGSNSGATP